MDAGTCVRLYFYGAIGLPELAGCLRKSNVPFEEAMEIIRKLKALRRALEEAEKIRFDGVDDYVKVGEYAK